MLPVTFQASQQDLQSIAAQYVTMNPSQRREFVANIFPGLTDDEIAEVITVIGALGGDATEARLRADSLARERRSTRLLKIGSVWAALGTVSMAASAYHGYKRNQSVGWALVWGFFGAIAPVITPTIAVAQGFGKRK